MDSNEKEALISFKRDSAYDGLIPVTLVAGALGAIVGTLPAVAGVLIFGNILHPLFAATPLLIWLFITLFKGCRDVRAHVITAAFSLFGAYLTAIACYSAASVAEYRMSIFNILPVTLMSLSKPELIPARFSAYVFPLIFTALGVAVAVLMLPKRNGNASALEEETVEAEPETETDQDASEPEQEEAMEDPETDIPS